MEKHLSLHLHLISWSGNRGLKEKTASEHAGRSAWNLGRCTILAPIFEAFFLWL